MALIETIRLRGTGRRMTLRFPERWRPANAAATGLSLVEALLIVALAWAVAVLFWMVLRPLGPLGRWQTPTSALTVADPLILTRFDPFFRSAATGTTAVTSLPLKLFGIRIDQAMGRGSAIIAAGDGLQNSFAVGEEIMPGVRLKSVSFDSVAIERGGATEQLFLDQSVATSAAPAAGVAGSSTAGSGATVATVQSLGAAIAFAPRIENGAVRGFVVGPKGASDVFAATGLQQGDVVTQINGIVIRSAEDAASALSSAGAAGSIAFGVERGGKPITVTAGVPK